MDLACGLDEILQMRPGEEVSQVHKLAVVLIFDVDNAPSVLSSSDLLPANNDRLLATDHCKWNDLFDGGICGALFIVELVVVVWVHSQVMEGELLLYALLERSALLECERVRLGDDWDNVDNV